MFDEMDRLRSNPHLFNLLTHYACRGKDNRETWLDRLMALEGVEPPELAKLHGELIAFGWVDQNTGQVPVCKVGTVPACYRITPAGLRAIRQIESPQREDDFPEQPEKTIPKFPRKKRQKTEAVSAVALLS